MTSDDYISNILKALSGGAVQPLMLAHVPGKVILGVGTEVFPMSPTQAREVANQLIVIAHVAEAEGVPHDATCEECRAAEAAEKGAATN